MTEIRFSCPGCGQHMSCDEPWAGHQIECPACHNTIVVPQVRGPSSPTPPPASLTESPRPAGAKLAPGVTRVPRSTAHAPAAPRKFAPRAPQSDNALLKYGLLLAVIAAVGGLGYFYGLPLLSSAAQPEPIGKAPAGEKTSQAGAGPGGPMGEMNAAMDVSDALDGGSSPRPRPAPATTNNARPRPGAPRR